MNIQSAYLAARGFKDQLQVDGTWLGDLVLSSKPAQENFWAQDIWCEPQVHKFSSIKEAGKILRDKAGLWTPYFYNSPRRAKLIQKELPFFKGLNKKVEYGKAIPDTPIGSWTLLDHNTLIASTKCREKVPQGVWEFDEDKVGPPNRAYLKLWEVFMRLGLRPASHCKILELGASPGGWTFVLAQNASEVIAVDRAPLDSRIAKIPSVHTQIGDAFSIKPDEKVDWVFSDLVCYPPKLWEWLAPWLADGKARNYVLTIKLQGDAHYDYIEKFASIENSQIVHLYQNKHELTFVLLQDEASILRW